MRLIEPTELITDVHWWELAGHHDSGALLDAWRQTHYACQAVAEGGKSWAQEQADDSHSSLIWVPDTHRLPDQFFAGVLVQGERDARVLLRPWDMKLFVVDGVGSPLDMVDAEGRSVDELIAWVRETLESHVGAQQQDSRPAPDLPEHPIGDGHAFGTPNQLAMAEVIRFYANADALLQRVAQLIETTDEPRVWPHHFDIASLATIDRDGNGAMTKTIGVGLTPPDPLSDTGYWYVSPWSRDDASVTGPWPDLPLGRWHQRDGSMPIAVLSTDDVTSTDDRADQHARTAAFIAEAYNTCRKALADG